MGAAEAVSGFLFEPLPFEPSRFPQEREGIFYRPAAMKPSGGGMPPAFAQGCRDGFLLLPAG